MTTLALIDPGVILHYNTNLPDWSDLEIVAE